jgi:hypothetical protein
MLGVLIMLTPGCRKEFINCQKAKERFTVLPVMDVNPWWLSNLKLLERANRSPEFTHEWLKCRKYSTYHPLDKTQNE